MLREPSPVGSARRGGDGQVLRGFLEKQAERLGFEFYFSPTQKGTKENGYAYKGIPQARYIPVESSGYAEALGAEERKRAKKAKKKAKALAQSEQAVAA